MGSKNKHLVAPIPAFYHGLDTYIRRYKIPKRGGMHVVGGEVLQELEGPGIVAYMHRHKNDIEYIGAAAMEAASLQMRWLAKEEVYDEFIGKTPEEQTRKDRLLKSVVKLVLQNGGTYTIKRGEDLEEAAAEYVSGVFANDGVIAWAPEGHRYVEDGRDVIQAHIRGGITMAAMEHNAPLIPTAIAGLLPEDRPGPVVVNFGPPMELEQVSDDDARKAAQKMLRLRKKVYVPALRDALQITADTAYDVRDDLLEQAAA
jgi:hypothetical protein